MSEINHTIIETNDKLLLYNENDFPSVSATAFLSLIAKIKRIIDFTNALKEDYNEIEDFDWLFIQ